MHKVIFALCQWPKKIKMAIKVTGILNIGERTNIDTVKFVVKWILKD